MSKHFTNLGFPLLLIGLFWFILIYGVAVASLPYNPLSVPRILTMNLQTVCPQGWAFFTRNPREELTYYYRLEGDTLVLQNYHNSSWNTALGVSRSARLKSMELATFSSHTRSEDWLSCEEGIKNYTLWNEMPTVVVQSGFFHPQICGEIIIEKKELVPWAWSKEIELNEAPSKIIKLFVVCPN